MRQIYKAGGFGKLVYAEGEYYHYMWDPIASYKDWRVGLPPQWYPTHSNAYYTGITGGSFTKVSCMGIPSKISHLQASNNRYKNPFGTEIEKDKLMLPKSLLFALLGSVVFNPVNKDETVADRYWLNIWDFKMFISELWGRMDLAERVIKHYRGDNL